MFNFSLTSVSQSVEIFLSKQSAFRFFCISFFILALANATHLTDPPYWDALLGVYTQANWLHAHGMNYALLLHQPEYSEGGPRLLVFDLFSTLFALLSFIAAPSGVFVVLHLLVFCAAALAITVYFQILRSQLPAGLAALWVWAAASNPIWSGQTASLYLEIPMTALLSVSSYFFYKSDFGKASVWALCAYAIKSAAFFHATVLMIVGLGLIAFGFRDQKTMKPLHPVLLLWPCLVLLGVNHWIGVHVYVGGLHTSRIGAYIWRTFQHIPYFFPVLAAEVVAILAFLLQAIPRTAASIQKKQTMVLDYHGRWLLFLVVFVFGFWGSFLTARFALVRYTVMVQLPMICLLSFLLIRRPALSFGTAGLILLLNLFNQHGQWLLPLPAVMGRSGELLERSREYLTDLASDQKLCRWLENSAGHRAIVTLPPFTEMLSVPEFGYVRHPLPAVIGLSNRAPYSGSLSRKDLLTHLIREKSLCIYAPTIFDHDDGSLKPRNGDVILWADQSLPAPLIVYERRWTKEEL